MSDIVTTLFQSRHVYVYRIPPRTSAVGGYKANDWADPKTGDLASTAIWTGRLRVVEAEEELPGGSRKARCDIRLEDSNTGELFALCPYNVQTNSDGKSSSGQGSGEAVEPVTDSSRYFVLRVESDDPSGQGKKRKAFIGMGFEDRDASFDFNVALSSWAKRQRNLADVSSMGGSSSGALTDVDGGSEASTGPSPHLPKDGPKDLSLKQGQTFSVKLPGSGQGRKIRGVGGSSSGSGLGGMGGGGGPLLPPPPSRRG